MFSFQSLQDAERGPRGRGVSSPPARSLQMKGAGETDLVPEGTSVPFTFRQERSASARTQTKPEETCGNVASDGAGATSVPVGQVIFVASGLNGSSVSPVLPPKSHSDPRSVRDGRVPRRLSL